jgi:hypothetical protein
MCHAHPNIGLIKVPNEKILPALGVVLLMQGKNAKKE